MTKCGYFGHSASIWKPALSALNIMRTPIQPEGRELGFRRLLLLLAALTTVFPSFRICLDLQHFLLLHTFCHLAKVF